jgi:hypothetical protein
VPRELGDERARYGQRSLRERLDDVIAWPASHHFATVVLLVVVVGAVLLAAARGLSVSLRDMAVGDCLYVPTAAALDAGSARPIGDAAAVTGILLTSGAERTACSASHGHEVSAIVVPAPSTMPTLAPGELPGTLLEEATMRSITAPLCEQAFEAYVGLPLEESRYVTFPVVPGADGAEAWIDGGRRTVCLVARSDGQWMDHLARASNE